MRKRKETPPDAVTSPEQWEIIKYYSKNGAPSVKKVAKRLLKQRDAGSAGGGSTR